MSLNFFSNKLWLGDWFAYLLSVNLNGVFYGEIVYFAMSFGLVFYHLCLQMLNRLLFMLVHKFLEGFFILGDSWFFEVFQEFDVFIEVFQSLMFLLQFLTFHRRNVAIHLQRQRTQEKIYRLLHMRLLVVMQLGSEDPYLNRLDLYQPVEVTRSRKQLKELRSRQEISEFADKLRVVTNLQKKEILAYAGSEGRCQSQLHPELSH